MPHSHVPSLFPPALKRGGTIGIVSPGRWPEPDWIAKGKEVLEEAGYQVVVHAQNYLKEGQLAGSDAARVEAIMDMFEDSTIDAIMCARGGTGSLRIVDQLDYKRIKQNPKPFIGFSDITVLLQAIHKRCGFATYHGPMLWNLAHDHHSHTAKDLFAGVGKKDGTSHLNFPHVECLRAGHAEGVLTGGNISLLQLLIGTPYDWSGKDAILLIEDTDAPLYKIDMKLHQFKLAGKFKDLRAVIVGEMVDITDGETGYVLKGGNPYGRDLRQILLENLPEDVPICMNFPCGHGKYITTLPVGAPVRLALSAHGAELSFTQG